METGFLCSNVDCIFKAGNSFDFTAYYSHGCDYRVAIDTLKDLFADRFAAISFGGLPEPVAVLARRMLARRQLYDFFRSMTVNSSDLFARQVQNSSVINAYNISHDTQRYSLFPLNDQQYGVMLKLFSIHSVDNAPKYSAAPIAIPFFANHHTVSHIVLLKDWKAKPVLINIEPYKFGWFGLLHHTLEHTTTVIGGSYAEAGKLNTTFSNLAPEQISTAVIHDPKSSSTSYLPDNAVYLINSPGASVAQLTTLSRSIPKLRVTAQFSDFHELAGIMEVEDFILNEALDRIGSRGVTPEVLAFLDEARLDNRARTRLIAMLHGRRQYDAAKTIKEHLRTQPVYFGEDSVLYESPDGYFSKKLKQQFPQYITNFTIRLDKNIVFTDRTDVFHSGTLFFDGMEFPVTLDKGSLIRAQDLENSVREYCLTTKTSKVPTIRDRSGAKQILTYLRDRVASIQPEEGIPFLGWNDSRTAFYGPYWIASQDGVSYAARPAHPEAKIDTYYDMQVRKDKHLHMDLPLPLVDLINQTLAYLARSYFNLPVKAISIFNNPGGRSILKQLFEGVGQVQPILLQTNQSPKSIRSFPAYATGVNAAQVSKLHAPLFVLCDKGIKFSTPYDESILQQAQQTMRYLWEKALDWLQSPAGDMFTQASSVHYPIALSKEGCSVVESACGVQWQASKPFYAALDTMFGGIPLADTAKHFEHDINAHVIKVDTRMLPGGLDIGDLHLELTQVDPNTRLVGDILEVSSFPMLEAMENFYHETPVVKKSFDADALTARLGLSD